MSFEEELGVAKEAAREAGKVMEHYRENGFTLERKTSYTDVVTEADHECQEKIIEILGDAFPGDGFLAEENDMTPDGEERVWIIDPIDGTKNFVHGFPFYCTSIGLKVGGEANVGVVYSPVRGEMYHAVEGGGAFCNGEEITVSDIESLKDAMIITRLTDWDEVDIRKTEARFLDDLLSTPSSFRRPGCAALDMCMVASGRADGQAIVTINEWDIAAGEVILSEAGGKHRVRDAAYDGYLEMVASNGRIQKHLEEVFDRNVRG